ncbi:MAG TPA: hypothetical protein PLY87_13235 [Planctomycetaceae bacterium]|nr:hypothetical protein [Planctomycetaceae bacterium]
MLHLLFHQTLKEFMMSFRICLTFIFGSVFVPAALAEKNVEIKPKIAELGMVIATETFENPLAEPLAAVKGEWKVVDGVLTGKELTADKHAAVLNYQMKNHNSVVRFSFKFDGTTKGFNFSLNHAKGHLFRVIVSPTSLSINLDKDKQDPASKAIVLGSKKGSFEQGKWYTMQIEMLGSRVVAQTDNGMIVEGSHETLDTDKPNYRFVMKGDSLALDDLQVWMLK